MESKKQMGSFPSSSFPPDIFGAKESSPGLPPPTGVFASIFPPPPTVVGRRSSSDFIGSLQKHSFGNHPWSSKHGDPAMRSENRSCSVSFKDGSIFCEERAEPCHLSSSLYYGGQDVYSQPSGDRVTGSYPMSKKDGVEDDPNGNSSHDASRGNWWQGSLYY